MSEYELLFEGPIGRMRPEDVLQFVAQAGGAVRVSFETEDRALGSPRGVDLEVDGGRLVGLGPRGTGMRLGELAVARGVLPRGELESLASGGGGARLGERLVAAGHLDEAGLDDLLWERHARVVWSLLAWERGRFVVSSIESLAPECIVVDPPIALSALLLDGLQRAESALGPSPS
jgi:hypothetical protein